MNSTALKIAGILISISCVRCGFAAEATLGSRADEVSKLFCESPGHFDQIFAPSFRSAVPDEKLTSILKDIFSQAGSCKSIAPVPGDPNAFTFTFEKGQFATVHLAVDPKLPHLVTGFFIEALHAQSMDSVLSEFKKLPGSVSLLVAQLTDSNLKTQIDLNADQPLAIGSAFKLYVFAEWVAELESGQRHLDEVVHLTEDAKSLPSGFLQNWPTGSPITLHTLASLMISQSDNTAADQMISTLGRVKIEQMLTIAGHSQPKMDIPFLTTLEMFKIKGDATGKAADEYLAATPPDRRIMLNHPIARMPRSGIQTWDKPRHVNDIEWFASTRDLANAMRWIKIHTEKSDAKEARAILAINPGLFLSSKQWDFIGFKGGSEPGVLNLTYLLHTAGPGDRWFVICATWNNPANALDENAFLTLVQQTIELTK